MAKRGKGGGRKTVDKEQGGVNGWRGVKAERRRKGGGGGEKRG